MFVVSHSFLSSLARHLSTKLLTRLIIDTTNNNNDNNNQKSPTHSPLALTYLSSHLVASSRRHVSLVSKWHYIGEAIGDEIIEEVESAVPLDSCLDTINLYGSFRNSSLFPVLSLNHKLYWLIINQDNGIGPDGAVSVAKLLNKLPALEYLDFSSMRLRERSIRHLTTQRFI